MNNIPSKGLVLKLQASGSPGLEWVEWELLKGVTPALICHPFIDPSSNLCPDFEVPQRPLTWAVLEGSRVEGLCDGSPGCTTTVTSDFGSPVVPSAPQTLHPEM